MHCIDAAYCIYYKHRTWRGLSVCLSLCWSHGRTLQKWLKRSRCRLTGWHGWAQVTIIRWGLTYWKALGVSAAVYTAKGSFNNGLIADCNASKWPVSNYIVPKHPEQSALWCDLASKLFDYLLLVLTARKLTECSLYQSWWRHDPLLSLFHNVKQNEQVVTEFWRKTASPGRIFHGEVNLTPACLDSGAMQSTAAVALMPLLIFCCVHHISDAQCFSVGRTIPQITVSFTGSGTPSRVCMSVCPLACLKNPTSKFHHFSVHVTRSSDSVFSDSNCLSCYVDDVTFSHNGANGPETTPRVHCQNPNICHWQRRRQWQLGSASLHFYFRNPDKVHLVAPKYNRLFLVPTCSRNCMYVHQNLLE